MNKLKQSGKLIACILLLASFFVTALPVTSFAEENWPQDVSVTAEGACVMDADSGTILYGKNADTAYYPASITKVMTALLTLENCESLEEMVSFTQSAVELGEDNATIIGASAGDELSVRDCLYSLLFKSANEVANALAEHVGAKFPERKEAGMSDRDVFVAMMNERAASLGCTNTHFDNPSGLTDPDHYTTAHDMCLILAAAIQNERFVEIESRTYWTHGPIKRYPDPDDPWNTVYQSHRMIRKNSYYYYDGVFAGKTGFTTMAGNTLVTACRRNGMTLVVTVLNGHMTHYADTKRLLDFGYNNFYSLKLTEHDTTYQSIQDDLSVMGLPVTDAVALAIDENSSLTLPKTADISMVQQSLGFDLTEEDPEDAVAKLRYTYADRQIGTAYLRGRMVGRNAALLEVEEDPLYLALTEKSTPDMLTAGAEAAGSEALRTGESEGNGQAAVAGEGTVRADGTENPPESAADEALEAQADNGRVGLAGIFSGLHVSPTVMFVLKIAGGVVALFVLIGIWLLHQEKKEAKQRARRRQKRLKHTRDLTGQQNITLDLMVQQKLREDRRRRSRRKR